MTMTTMLEYQKLILQKVSFSKELFQIEIKKSIRWLSKNELLLLYTWLIVNYKNIYSDIIKTFFVDIF